MASKKLLQHSTLPWNSVFQRCGFPAAVRPVHACLPLPAGQKWRMRQGKSRSGNEYGPLTDLPDWTYTDGRPPVMGKGQLRRQVKQFEFSQRIRKLLNEMDTAKGGAGEAESTGAGDSVDRLLQEAIEENQRAQDLSEDSAQEEDTTQEDNVEDKTLSQASQAK